MNRCNVHVAMSKVGSLDTRVAIHRTTIMAGPFSAILCSLFDVQTYLDKTCNPNMLELVAVAGQQRHP